MPTSGSNTYRQYSYLAIQPSAACTARVGVGHHVLIGVMSDRVLQNASGKASFTGASILDTARTNHQFNNRPEWRQLDAGLPLVWKYCKVSGMKPRSMSFTVVTFPCLHEAHVNMTLLEDLDSEVMNHWICSKMWGSTRGFWVRIARKLWHTTGVPARGPHFQNGRGR